MKQSYFWGFADCPAQQWPQLGKCCDMLSSHPWRKKTSPRSESSACIQDILIMRFFASESCCKTLLTAQMSMKMRDVN